MVFKFKMTDKLLLIYILSVAYALPVVREPELKTLTIERLKLNLVGLKRKVTVGHKGCAKGKECESFRRLQDMGYDDITFSTKADIFISKPAKQKNGFKPDNTLENNITISVQPRSNHKSFIMSPKRVKNPPELVTEYYKSAVVDKKSEMKELLLPIVPTDHTAIEKLAVMNLKYTATESTPIETKLVVTNQTTRELELITVPVEKQSTFSGNETESAMTKSIIAGTYSFSDMTEPSKTITENAYTMSTVKQKYISDNSVLYKFFTILFNYEIYVICVFLLLGLNIVIIKPYQDSAQENEYIPLQSFYIETTFSA